MGNTQRGALLKSARILTVSLIGLLLTRVMIALFAPVYAAADTTLLTYTFNSAGTLYEAGLLSDSTSPYFWLNSGAKLIIANGIGGTIQGTLPTTDSWRTVYAAKAASATDNGAHPQNVFQLFLRNSVQSPSVQVYVNRIADNLSNTANRHAYNGESLFARYKDVNNYYYAGIRADGAVVIKKKKNGVYQTLATKTGVFPGAYNSTTNYDLIPLNKWIGLKLVVTDTTSGSKLSLYTDVGQTGTWTLQASATDDPTKFGSAITGAGLVGIQSDFADAQFDNFVLSDTGSVTTSPPPPPPPAGDTTPPSAATNLAGNAVSTSQINLTWSASSDNVAVTGYRVFRGATQIGTVTTSSYSDTGLTASTAYSYTVKAVDAAGNVSASSNAATATTQSASTPPPSAGYDSAIMNDSPVMYLTMGSPSSGSESDKTGNGHNGSYKGGAPTAANLPNGETAADFNGSSQYLTVPSSNALSISTTHALTWEAWIRPDTFSFSSASGDGYVDWMGKCQDYSPTCEWEARIYGNVTPEGRPDRLSAYVFNPSAGLGSAADWQPASTIAAGKWLHIVAEYQTTSTPSGCNSSYPGTINIWVNGVKQSFADHAPTGCMSQYSIKPIAGSSPLNIGTMAMDTWFKGAVGKVAIYNKLLSQTQINAHYTAMTGQSVTGSCGATCTF